VPTLQAGCAPIRSRWSTAIKSLHKRCSCDPCNEATVVSRSHLLLAGEKRVE
jgi:hypothetical protein